MAKSAAKPDKLDGTQGESVQRDAGITEPVRSKKGGGGKLSRSETVTVRLDPKLNYLCELAARAQRRTKSSFIEWAIENALASVGIPGERKSAAGDLYTIEERNSDLWDVDEPDRLVALATFAPSLMTHDEQVIWKIVATSAFLWKGRWEDDGEDEEVWRWDPSQPYKIILERLRAKWDTIKQVAEGTEPREDHYELKQRLVRGSVLNKGNASGALDSLDTDLDDGCPF